MPSARPVDCAAPAQRLLGLLDLTLLDPQAAPAAIEALCARAASRHGAPAALCLWPTQLAAARAGLGRRGLANLPLATVVNFPDGGSDLDRLAGELDAARASGADEIDAVLPWRALLAGDVATCEAMLALCRQRCGDRVRLKIILESGCLPPAAIVQASRLAIAAGADFLKTSTGKAEQQATPEAAALMLGAIADSGSRCGFKASGGLRTPAQAWQYLELAERALGAAAVTPARFRLGASSLVDALHRCIDGDAAAWQ